MKVGCVSQIAIFNAEHDVHKFINDIMCCLVQTHVTPKFGNQKTTHFLKSNQGHKITIFDVTATSIEKL